MMQVQDVLEVVQQGDGLQQLPNGTDFHYPCEGFTGMGQVGNRLIHCITAEVQMLCHLGYEPDEKVSNYLKVELTVLKELSQELAKLFGLALPFFLKK